MPICILLMTHLIQSRSSSAERSFHNEIPTNSTSLTGRTWHAILAGVTSSLPLNFEPMTHGKTQGWHSTLFWIESVWWDLLRSDDASQLRRMKNRVQELLQASPSPLNASFCLCKRGNTSSPFSITLPSSFAFCILGEAFLIHKLVSRDKNEALAPGRLLSAENLAPSVWGKLKSLPGGKYLIVLPPSKMTLKPTGLSMAIDIHDGPVTSWVFQFPWLNHNFWKQIPSFYIIVRFYGR